MNTLTLRIGNLDTLQHGAVSQHRFDRAGGTIGSQGANWLLVDRDRHIQPIHCEIRWLEGSFCVIDRCHRTYLNGSAQCLGTSPPVRLQEGDELRVGAYRLKVHLQAGRACEPSLESLLAPGQSALDALLAEGVSSTMGPVVPALCADICETFKPEVNRDPLAALDACSPATPDRDNALQHLLREQQP